MHMDDGADGRFDERIGMDLEEEERGIKESAANPGSLEKSNYACFITLQAILCVYCVNSVGLSMYAFSAFLRTSAFTVYMSPAVIQKQRRAEARQEFEERIFRDQCDVYVDKTTSNSATLRILLPRRSSVHNLSVQIRERSLAGRGKIAAGKRISQKWRYASLQRSGTNSVACGAYTSKKNSS